QSRKDKQQEVWKHELEQGARFEFPDEDIQKLFDASLVALLQLHDHEFISPGPFLYHHFWFRDAAPMIAALDCAGFTKRSQSVIDAFPKRMMGDGFFKAPDGEWDSNGTVLWIAYRHFQLTRSTLWLKSHYPVLVKAARWIIRTKNQQPQNNGIVHGLMPKSISAEHLGTVDQYYWDSFWSLAGLKAMTAIAHELGKKTDEEYFEHETNELLETLAETIYQGEEKLGVSVIPAGPARGFDEGAIGSVSAVYPLELHLDGLPHAVSTVRAVKERFVDDRGFFHPLIHSGYNPYLTLQVAHSYLLLGDTQTAWEIANSIFRQATETNTFPEAIHPITGGGTMGDGHHGWAAAEVVLFLRRLLVDDRNSTLVLLNGVEHIFSSKRSLRVSNVPTRYGVISFSLEFESAIACTFRFSHKYFPGHAPKNIELHLPFVVEKIMPAAPAHLYSKEANEKGITLQLSPEVTTIFLQLLG
ncbi:MAG: hypothetical protein L0Y80_07310, partial [Ignavibacteriae bacterium]|nr:hypothetical protein [Ignavibacteriota bacterium]